MEEDMNYEDRMYEKYKKWLKRHGFKFRGKFRVWLRVKEKTGRVTICSGGFARNGYEHVRIRERMRKEGWSYIGEHDGQLIFIRAC